MLFLYLNVRGGKPIYALEMYEENRMLKVSDVWKYFGVKSAFELTNAQYAACCGILNQKDELEEKKKRAAKK